LEREAQRLTLIGPGTARGFARAERPWGSPSFWDELSWLALSPELQEKYAERIERGIALGLSRARARRAALQRQARAIDENRARVRREEEQTRTELLALARRRAR
jgi:hypothetical protein